MCAHNVHIIYNTFLYNKYAKYVICQYCINCSGRKTEIEFSCIPNYNNLLFLFGVKVHFCETETQQSPVVTLLLLVKLFDLISFSQTTTSRHLYIR